MRDIEAMWTAWRSGSYVGDTKPSTRVTVQKLWTLQPTATATVGTWKRGPARYYQLANNSQIETEVPNVESVNMSRSVDTDAGTCEIVIRNDRSTPLGQPELPPGQFGSPGYYTFDHGASQDSKARWGHISNPWQEVLAPNALLRTYVGFGGADKTIGDAVDDGNLVLYGVWLVDDVTIATEGTISIRCRDMGKLLVDQQLFPPLVPTDLYPIEYHRWEFKTVSIPADPTETVGDHCFASVYGGPSYWKSSTDELYGEYNTGATGHPPSDAFDMSFEPGPGGPGYFSHQRTFWLSEPYGSPNDSAWIEFTVENGQAGIINQIYYHAWSGAIEGRGVHRVMVSVYEHGDWVTPETSAGGFTPQGIPYVCTFVPGTELAPATDTNLRSLPRDYCATAIRLTVTSLIPAPEGGYRAGARKVMACFTQTGTTKFPTLTFAGASIPVNNNNRVGYWQVRANGAVYAFGDARVHATNSPSSGPAATVVGMCAHPDGVGYWFVDVTGRVVSAGSAHHFGDLGGTGRTDVVDIAPAPDGDGYWLLTLGGQVAAYGSAVHHGDSPPSGTMPSGAPVRARSIDSHPSTNGYWVLWTNGHITAHNVTHYGHCTDRAGFTLAEYVGSLRRTSTGAGYWVTSGSGIIQAKGDAQHKGNANLSGYDGDRWFKGLCWDLLPSPVDDSGYAIQSADGNLWIRGNTTGLSYGSVGTGKATQRFPGNYRDYSDVIRDLVLWSGFYLFSVSQAPRQLPAVYGNVEDTGAYAEDPLPKEMFDKKPVMDTIREIRDIVGYVVYIDAEGGFRFESPNWWSMGNYLMDGTPLNYMPEVDETVQLTNHSVTRSAAAARSRLIISTQDPYPAVAGQTLPTGVLTTEIIPKTAPDLRGLLVPAMWHNGQFLRKNEQKVMADLIDMRMWFARRTASVSCIANPLIDINDQVRVIERRTGEIYVHYVTGVEFSHDLLSGEFTMQLNTYWLGGTQYGQTDYYMAADSRPDGAGYWQCTIGAQIYAYGTAELYDSNEADSHLHWVVGFRSTPTGDGYYTLDTSGKVLTYGDAVHRGELAISDTTDIPGTFGPITDFALTPSGNGYWILQRTGTVTAFGDAVNYGSTTNGGRKMPSGVTVTAQSIESHPSTQGYWVLWADGVVDAFNLTDHGSANRVGYTFYEHTSCLRSTPDGGGYWIPSMGGDQLQVFGNAVDYGNATQYPDPVWPAGLVWDMIISPTTGGYAFQRADGALIDRNFTLLLGNEGDPAGIVWALVAPEDHEPLLNPALAYPVSGDIMKFLAGTASPSANNAVLANFEAPTENTLKGQP